MKNAKIAAGDTVIKSGQFRNCRGLAQVTIPASVRVVENYAFDGCGSLRAIVVDKDNPRFCSVDGVLFSKDRTRLIRCPEGRAGAYAVPDGVRKIGAFAFCHCAALERLTLPASLGMLGDGAFFGCGSLMRLAIPAGVRMLGKGAFGACESLARLDIPSGARKIGEGAFFCCTSLKRLAIPAGIRTLGDLMFWECRSLSRLQLIETDHGPCRCQGDRIQCV